MKNKSERSIEAESEIFKSTVSADILIYDTGQSDLSIRDWNVQGSKSFDWCTDADTNLTGLLSHF